MTTITTITPAITLLASGLRFPKDRSRCRTARSSSSSRQETLMAYQPELFSDQG